MSSSPSLDSQSAETLSRPPPSGLVWPYWRDPVLRIAFLVVGVVIAFQVTITLLHPPWASAVIDWDRAAMAWPELGLVIYVSAWLTRHHRSEALSWWLLSVAMVSYTIARNLWSVYDRFIFPNHVPFPTFPDIFFILQYPFFFLALALLPGIPPWGPRLKVILDCLLLMGAASALSWYFVLAPIYLESRESLIGKEVNLAYLIGDLAMLFGLTVALIYHRCQVARAVIALLIVAVVCLVIADSWAAWLIVYPNHVYRMSNPPDVFWSAFYLLVPLAGLVQVRLTQCVLTTPSELHVAALDPQPAQQREEAIEVFRVLSPFMAALVACVVIAVRAIIAPLVPVHPVGPSLIIFGLLLLVLVRQGITVLENARLRRRWAIAQANEQAMREAKQQMEIFLGIVGHELKTPLTALTLRQQLAERSLRSAQRLLTQQGADIPRPLVQIGEQHAAAQAQLARLSHLVSDLLDVSRIQEGRLKLQLAPTDLTVIVSAAVEEQCQQAPERNIRLHLPVEGTVLVSADAARIEQVMTNYLTNALKYSPEDCPVDVGVQVEGQQARVWVRDQGPGLPPAEQERIWERFYRAPGVEILCGSGIGLGLGLHVCKTIIEQHQGQVGVLSVPGQGAMFWFTLQLIGPEEEK